MNRFDEINKDRLETALMLLEDLTHWYYNVIKEVNTDSPFCDTLHELHETVNKAANIIELNNDLLFVARLTGEPDMFSDKMRWLWRA